MDEIKDVADSHFRDGEALGFRTGTRDFILMCLGAALVVHYNGEYGGTHPSHEHRHVRRQIDDPVLDGEVLRVNHV